jgi:hypothetical protein
MEQSASWRFAVSLTALVDQTKRIVHTCVSERTFDIIESPPNTHD